MNSYLRKWLTVPFLVVYSLWAVLFYQLAFIAWTTQYSYLGVLVVIAASLAFYFVFPKQDRKFVFRFTVFALMISYAIDSFASEPLVWRIIDWVVFVALALVVGKLLVGQKTRRLFWVIVFMTLFEIWVPLGDLSALSNYRIDYIGHLASQDPQVSSLPVATIPDPTRPGEQTILTLQAHRPDKLEAQNLINQLAGSADNQLENALVELQHSYDVISVQPGRIRFHVNAATPQQMANLPVTALGFSAFPFNISHFLNINGSTRMYFSLSASPSDLLSTLLDPSQLPTNLADLSMRTNAIETENWNRLTGRNPVTSVQGFTLQNGLLSGTYNHRKVDVQTSGVVILGVYQLFPKTVQPSPTVVVEGNNLIQVVALPPAQPRVVATLYGSYSHPLTSDMIIADVLGKGYDQLLINTVPAQIVQLSAGGSWQNLWTSGRETFRFETVISQKGGDLIIANSPSLLSGTPIRYLGGYVYRNHQLIERFRVYHGNLVNIQTVYVTSPKNPNLLMSVFDHQEIMLLGQTRIPWYALTIVGYVLALVIGLVRRFERRSAA